MGFVDKWPSRIARAMVFSKSGGRETFFGQVQKIHYFWMGSCPCPNLPPRKVRGGKV
jgi:hypothetical protein